MISNVRSSENAPAYTMVANEDVIKAIVSFFYRDDSDTVLIFLTIYVPVTLRAEALRSSYFLGNILKVLILIGFIIVGNVGFLPAKTLCEGELHKT